jgi:uncharacterized protein (TIGR03435 family)
MLRAAAGLLLAVLWPAAIAGQTPAPAPAPAFDLADVHVRSHSSNPTPFASGGVQRGGRYDIRNGTMLDLIQIAYNVNDPEFILGGPNWLERDRFDIVAKAPPATPPDTVRQMLQTLLADRFKLVLHRDERPMNGYVLAAGKGKPKMKEATTPGGCQPGPPPAPGSVPSLVLLCHGVTMEAFAQLVRNIGGGYITQPVTDATGLKGFWDFELRFTPRAFQPQAGGDAVSIFDAVDQQLGLKLEPQKVSTPVLVVDSVNQKPTDNPSGVAQNLPAPPPQEFDIAEIKLSPPDTPPMLRLQPGGRLDAQGATLQMLMRLAWDINGDEMVANAPKWFDSTRYTLLAKTSAAITGPDNQIQVDIDDVRLMLRALLVERFKLTTHLEDRPVTAYTLLADKPKLTKADPANRTGFKEGPAPDGKDTRNAMLSRMVTVRNMTMAQFAEDLPRMASGYIHNPVVDATGIEGAFDFTLTFTPIGALNRARPGGDAPSAGAAPAAADPSGGLSLFDAINKQLGLKLEMRKRPMPVLVIDHVEEKPIDN